MISIHLEGIEVGGIFFAQAQAAHDKIEQDLHAMADRGTVAVGKDILATLGYVGEKLKARHSSPWNGRLVNDTNNLQSRTGGGLRSILNSIRMTSENINVVAGQITTGNMTIHQTGGTIKPKRSKYLTIPLPAAMDGRGVPLRRRARDWDNTFVARSRRGSLLIFRKDGKGVTPLYLLKQSVYIPPRLGMDGMLEGALPYFERRAFETLDKIFEVK